MGAYCRVEESREALAQQSQALIALLQGPGSTLVAFVQQYRHIDAMRAARKAAEASLGQAKVGACQVCFPLLFLPASAEPAATELVPSRERYFVALSLDLRMHDCTSALGYVWCCRSSRLPASQRWPQPWQPCKQPWSHTEGCRLRRGACKTQGHSSSRSATSGQRSMSTFCRQSGEVLL